MSPAGQTFRDGPDVYVTTRTPKSVIRGLSTDPTVTQVLFGPGRYYGVEFEARPAGAPGITINGGAVWGAVFAPPLWRRLPWRLAWHLRLFRYRLLGRIVR